MRAMAVTRYGGHLEVPSERTALEEIEVVERGEVVGRAVLDVTGTR